MRTLDAIEVKAVTRRFGSRYALRGVSARFEPGTVTVIQGPNGAGKSTLLAILATLLTPTSGSVLYPPVRDLGRVRAAIGWVGHESLCYPTLTGRQNVEFAAQLYGVPAAAAWQETCARVGAEEFGDRPVRVLSRGQRQRIALARALVHRPGALLLDEPASGLDAASRRMLVNVLRDEAARGSVVVLASHSKELAAEVADRRLYVERGKLTSATDV